jgi:hypothetical protein
MVMQDPIIRASSPVPAAPVAVKLHPSTGGQGGRKMAKAVGVCFRAMES